MSGDCIDLWQVTYKITVCDRCDKSILKPLSKFKTGNIKWQCVILRYAYGISHGKYMLKTMLCMSLYILYKM